MLLRDGTFRAPVSSLGGILNGYAEMLDWGRRISYKVYGRFSPPVRETLASTGKKA